MLFIDNNTEAGHVRLTIRNPFARAWISHYPRLTEDFRRVEGAHDWRLYVQRVPELPPSAGKSPSRLLIESYLRSWLLRRFKRRLSDLRFEQLRQIAELQAKSFNTAF